MKRKNMKEKIILLFIAIVSIICIIIIVLVNQLKNKMNEAATTNEESSLCGDIDNEKNNIGLIEYFNINTCMNLYLNKLNTKSSRYYGYDQSENYTIIAEESQIKQNIYDVLSEKYIKENNITVQNVYSFVKAFADENSTYIYVPIEAKAIQQKEISSFLIHGLVENSELSFVDEIYAIINMDMIDKVYSIEPIHGDYASINEINVQNYNIIVSANENNHYIQMAISSEDIAKDYINLYKRLAIGSPEKMYEFIDKEYREARFGSVDEFKKYILDNKNEISKIRAEKYQRIDTENYTQYVCIDQNGNYYIIRENGVLDFSFILDTYTIDIPEFTEKYNSSTPQEKVILNLNKYMLALNNKDYKYAYSKLAGSFKTNRFPTQELYENYLKLNYYNKNKFEYVKYQKRDDGYYVYEVSITNEEMASSLELYTTFIMKLRRRNRL